MRIKYNKNIISTKNNTINYRDISILKIPASPTRRRIIFQFCFAPSYINYNR
jgi:hypothetical protein